MSMLTFPPLSSKELSYLLSLLSEETVTSSNLEAILGTFHRHWSRKDHFRVGSALTVLLQQRDLLPSTAQRIAAIFLLYELYRSDSPTGNPFSAFFTELLQPTIEDDRAASGLPCGHSLGPSERLFLLQLLTPTIPRELFKRTPVNIAATDPSTVQAPDTATLLAVLQDHLEDVSPTNKAGMSCVLADPDPVMVGHSDDEAAGQAAESLLCIETVTAQPFEPGFIRPLPPLHVCEDEVAWLNPTESQHNVQWDDQMCTTRSPGSSKLFAKAYQETLSPQEQLLLSQQFSLDPNFVYSVGLTPQKLPQLVERNPTVAIDALLKLVNSAQISEYFAALLNMDMSLHSMEVVNRLTTAVDLPPEFLHLYINNCIHRCRGISDKSLQSRLVRLVCVFLQSLIRNKIINVQDEFLEIQTFCLEYNRIKEATALYRLLKTLESGEAPK